MKMTCLNEGVPRARIRGRRIPPMAERSLHKRVLDHIAIETLLRLLATMYAAVVQVGPVSILRECRR